MANNGNFEKMDKCFHPDFIMFGLSQGKYLWSWKLDNLKDYYTKEKEKGNVPKTGKHKTSAKFVDIDVAGYIANVKLEIYKDKTLLYIDNLDLFKFEDGWKIVCKTFYVVTK